MNSRAALTEKQLEALTELCRHAGESAGLPQPMISSWTGTGWEWLWSSVDRGAEIFREVGVLMSPFYPSDADGRIFGRAALLDGSTSGQRFQAGFPAGFGAHWVDDATANLVDKALAEALGRAWERVHELDPLAFDDPENAVQRFRERYVTDRK